MEAELFADTRRNVAEWSVFNLWSLALRGCARVRTTTVLARWSDIGSDSRVDGVTLVRQGLLVKGRVF